MTNQTLHLYRAILKNAKRFPSVKREGIIKEIKTEFRIKKDLKEKEKIEEAILLARKGLSQLSVYTALSSNSYTWTVNLENNPMPPSFEKGNNK